MVVLGLVVSWASPMSIEPPVLHLPSNLAPSSITKSLVKISPLRLLLESKTKLSFALTIPLTLPPIVMTFAFICPLTFAPSPMVKLLSVEYN